MPRLCGYQHCFVMLFMVLWGFGGTPAAVAAPAARPGFVTTEGTHFVLDGRPFYFQGTNASNMTITFSSQIDETTTLASGQSIIIIYAEA